MIKPVLDAIFRDNPFTERTPVSHALSEILEKLDSTGLVKANQELQAFYKSVKLRTSNIKTVAEQQKVIIDLFDNFFKKLFQNYKKN